MTSINSAIDRLFAGEIDIVSDRDLYPEDLSGDVPEPVKPHVSRTLANFALYSDTFGHTVGEYGLSERVYGQENGREFILRMQLMVNNSPFSGWRLDQALHLMEGHEEDLGKYRRLMNAVGYERLHKEIKASPEFMARQYLYDERTKEWVQIDWDDDNDRELPSAPVTP